MRLYPHHPGYVARASSPASNDWLKRGVVPRLFVSFWILPILFGCVSNKPASFLVPNMGREASLLTSAVVVNCSFVTNNYDFWWKGSSYSRCIEPAAGRSSNAPIIEVLETGLVLKDLRASYMNGIDSAYCLLTARVNGSPYVIWDIHIEELFGVTPKPRKASWFCHSTGFGNGA